MSDNKLNAGFAAATTEAIEGQLTGKKFWQSKTFWANIVMGGAIVLQTQTGFVMGPELQSLAIIGVNMLLRKITKEPIIW